MSDTSVDFELAGPTGAEKSKWAEWAEWLDDRLNPVLVKEVRQALRGKQFRSAFLFTVIMSVIVAVAIVLGNSGNAQWNPIGPPFFQGIFVCLTIAVVGFVPMATFTAMGAEWEENTYDLLILSHLRPRHIVFGKLLGAGAQALLYFSVFSPYIVFTFLLGGVDLKLVLVTLPMLAMISLALSAFAAGLSSLTDKRMGRVALMVLLSATLVGSCSAVIAMMVGALEMGIDFADDEIRMAITGISLLALVIGGFSVTIAVARLSHPEENRSTGLRVLTSVLVMTSLAWIAWANTFIRQPEFVAVMTMFLIAGVMIVSIFFVTEREALGLRVKNHLPSNPMMRLLVFPWLPGGARGSVWALLTLGIVVFASTKLILANAGVGIVSGMGSTTSSAFARNAILMAGAYCVVYLMIPSAVFTNRTKQLQRSTLARVMTPALFLGGILIPMIVGFLLGDTSLLQGRHLGNPFQQVDEILNGRGDFGAVYLLALGALLLQSMRMVRAFLEVTRAPQAGQMAAEGTGIALERVPAPDDETGGDA